MRKVWHENGLSIVLWGMFFLLFIGGLSFSGYRAYNIQQQEHGDAPVSYFQYLTTGDFLEATMENWESEFFGTFIYVTLTGFLFQKGSAESKDPDKPSPSDRDPKKSRRKKKKDAPLPVRKGGLLLKLYENSLGLAFLLLFLLALLLHAYGGSRAYSAELLTHGRPGVSFFQYFLTSQFWFESFQNWQSEFLGLGSMAILSTFLRQKGSPESKPVDSPHKKTGSE